MQILRLVYYKNCRWFTKCNLCNILYNFV